MAGAAPVGLMAEIHAMGTELGAVLLCTLARMGCKYGSCILIVGSLLLFIPTRTGCALTVLSSVLRHHAAATATARFQAVPHMAGVQVLVWTQECKK